VQLFFNLSDPLMENFLYEIESVRRFSSVSPSGSIPDETKILNFRHLLEKH
jgi:IS5 family transposase